MPAYQDYDNGFVRHLLTSSFEPVNTNFEEGVYLDDPADMTEGHRSLIKYLLGTPPVKPRGPTLDVSEVPPILAPSTQNKEFECGDCHEEFASLNQLRRHLRGGCNNSAVDAGRQRVADSSIGKDSALKRPPSQLGVMALSRQVPSLGSEEELTEEEEYDSDGTRTRSESLLDYPPMHDEVDVISIPTWALPFPATNPFAGPRPHQDTPPCDGVSASIVTAGPESQHVTTQAQLHSSPEATSEPVVVPPGPALLPGRTQLLLLVGKMWKLGMLALHERACLKQLALEADERLLGAVLAFDVTQDVDDLVETLQLLVILRTTDSPEKSTGHGTPASLSYREES